MQKKQRGFLTTPHNLNDAALDCLPGERYRIFNFIYRKTIGWRKPKDPISTSQFTDHMKLTRPTILGYLQELEKHEIIFCERAKGKTSVYGLDFGEEAVKDFDRLYKPTSREFLQVVVKYSDKLVAKLVKYSDIQNKGLNKLQNKINQEARNSSIGYKHTLDYLSDKKKPIDDLFSLLGKEEFDKFIAEKDEASSKEGISNYEGYLWICIYNKLKELEGTQ